MKNNADKSKVMILGGEEGLVYEVLVDGIQLEDVSEFALNESGTDDAKCCREV